MVLVTFQMSSVVTLSSVYNTAEKTYKTSRVSGDILLVNILKPALFNDLIEVDNNLKRTSFLSPPVQVVR